MIGLVGNERAQRIDKDARTPSKDDYSDTDCRMTAFLLLDGLLHAESTEADYNGTYLMFDTEAIDNADIG